MKKLVHDWITEKRAFQAFLRQNCSRQCLVMQYKYGWNNHRAYFKKKFLFRKGKFFLKHPVPQK